MRSSVPNILMVVWEVTAATSIHKVQITDSKLVEKSGQERALPHFPLLCSVERPGCNVLLLEIVLMKIYSLRNSANTDLKLVEMCATFL